MTRTGRVTFACGSACARSPASRGAAAAAALLAVAGAHAQDSPPTRLQAPGARSVALVAAFGQGSYENLTGARAPARKTRETTRTT